MPKIEIPQTLRNFFKKVGIDDLPRIFRVLGSVRGVVVVNVPSSAIPIFLGGKKVVKIASVTLANDTLLSHLVTVPKGKRWLLLGLHQVNPDNVDRACSVYLWNEAAKTSLITLLLGNTVLTTAKQAWPNVFYNSGINQASGWHPRILEAGYTLEFEWSAGGASTGATDADGQVVEYLEIDVE